MTPANLAGKNARTIYAQKTVDGRGAPRQVDDTSKVQGFMVDNGDGTYSNYLPDGTLEKTYKPNNGFMGGLTQNLESVANDTSGVIGKFIIPALAMGYGADMINGGFGGAGSSIAEQAAAVGETAGGSGGLIGAESMAVPELAAPSYGLSGGTATFGAANPAATVAAMNAPAAATGFGGLLTGNAAAGVLAAGGLLGALAGKDTQTTQSSSKDPWGPAQPYLLDNLKTNAAMQQHYQANPFSQEQMAAYQGVMNANANGMANAPVMSGIANNFMQSNRGRMAAMPQFTQGTQAAPINWDAYKNIGLLKG